ncbi:hypothetical protein RUM44_008177 [Polyplax serrata]|uniref:BTB domain-containing protein n=1 Tax=Polyplax serrata TaxID=468196 RepID=A0ABR1B9L5_POLSC
MRKNSAQLNNSILHCSCPFCRSEAEIQVQARNQAEKYVKLSNIRKFRSSEIVNTNFQSVNIEILDPHRQHKLKHKTHPVEVIFEGRTSPLSVFDARSEHSLHSAAPAGKNFYGIWQKCHDSNARMPWSMANCYPSNQQDLEVANQDEEVKEQSFDSRVFPFQSTPSGNLKVVPQQVVFESKKVSVLVADPRHTRVNVKAELAKQQNLTGAIPQIFPESDSKIMETDAKKHQILSALSLMGGEGRGAALNDILPGMPSALTMNAQNKLKTSNQINDVLSTFVMSEGNDERDDGRSVESEEAPKPELNLIKLGFTSSVPIDWNKLKLPQKTNLYKHMHYRITNYVNPDCLVQIEDVQFNCHLLVLQCYSAYFNEKTSKEVVKLPSENVSPKAFELIYEWMTYVHGDSYTILKRDNILEVFLAAQFLGIKELEEQCWAFVDCEDLFVEDTAFILYLEAKKYGISAIMELMIPRIMKFFLTLVSSKDFLELQLDEVFVLLSSNYISVHSEIEVFMSAVRWLWHDWKERKECLEQVMSCVRFGLIAPWQLVDIRRNPENPEFLEITSHPGVQQMIDNGLAYAIIKYWYGNQTGDYYHWIDLLGLSEPPSRNWAGEEKNYVTYREFLHDLEQYRKELYNEKEKVRAKRESQASKVKRGSDQSGLTTSPRDSLQPPQPERRISSRKHTSSISGKSARVENALGETMRSEIIKQYVENTTRDCTSSFTTGFSQPPPTIWNVNTILKQPDVLHQKQWFSRLDVISEGNKRSGQSRIPVAYSSVSNPLQQRTEPVTLTVPNPGLSTSPGVACNEILSLSRSCKNQTKMSRLTAATVIQRAFRKHRMKKLAKIKAQAMEASSQAKNKKETLNSGSGVINQEKSKYSAKVHRSLAPKDYLREGSLFFAERESVLVFGGIDPHSKYGDGRNTGRNIFRYNSECNQWDLVGELPQPRHHHAVAFLKGKVYLAGGTDPRDDEKGKTIVVGTVWSFDPVTRAWYKEKEMSTPRKNFGLAVMNGKLLAIGGQDKDGRILSSVERYDPTTGNWEYIAKLNTERTGAAATKYNDTVWVAGGMTASRKTPLTSTVESYDAKHNVWVEQSALRFPRCFGCLFAMNETLYYIGGAGRASEKERTTSSCNAIDLWNSKDEEWKLHFAMSIPRHGHAVAYLGTQILIIGGVTTAYLRALTDVECFCCERRTWVKGLSVLPVPLSGHGAVTLPPASLL